MMPEQQRQITEQLQDIKRQLTTLQLLIAENTGRYNKQSHRIETRPARTTNIETR
jgi:hypothetical protein